MKKASAGQPAELPGGRGGGARGHQPRVLRHLSNAGTGLYEPR